MASVIGDLFNVFKQRVYTLAQTRMLEESCILKTAATNWTDSTVVPCHPQDGIGNYAANPLDFEDYNTYPVDVYLLHDQPIKLADRIICSYGTVEVIRIGPLSNLGATRFVTGKKR